VAHELGQHWFGDLAQGRDWANIWLNEGFATYLTALYTQHHEGNDAYRFEIYQDQLDEQAQDRQEYRRPIVDRHYTDPMQMLDVTTHEKGAAVLDMLRHVLDGTEAAAHPASQNEPLFGALRFYLTAHRAQGADTADLIEAVRTSTGQELEWFFREWVFMGGHPDYKVEASYDAGKRIEKLKIAQTQQVNAVTPVFDMPIELAFYGAKAERKTVQIRDNLLQQDFEIPLDFEPQWVDFDPDGFIDKTVEFRKSGDALIAEAEKDPSMMSRLWASEQLGTKTQADSSPIVAALAHVLANDPFYAVRAAASASLGSIGTAEAKSVLLSALQQPDSRVRTAVVQALGHFSADHAVYAELVDILHNDASYASEAAAAEEIGRSGMPGAFDVLQSEAAKSPEIHVMRATLNGLATTRDARAAAILLDLARPGVPERVRLSALAGLEGLKDAVARDHAQDLAEIVRAALHDPFLPVRETGVELAGVFTLTQFQEDIRAETQSAPMAEDREAAQRVLEQLERSKEDRDGP
jgi:aminopeptidase N